MEQPPIWVLYLVAAVAALALVVAVIAYAGTLRVREMLAADRAAQVMRRIWGARLGDLQRYFVTEPFRAADVSALLLELEADLEELLDVAPRAMRKRIEATRSLLREHASATGGISREGLRDVLRGAQELGQYLGDGGNRDV